MKLLAIFFSFFILMTVWAADEQVAKNSGIAQVVCTSRDNIFPENAGNAINKWLLEAKAKGKRYAVSAPGLAFDPRRNWGMSVYICVTVTPLD